jgi:predicted PurR-regulated permease PerM
MTNFTYRVLTVAVVIGAIVLVIYVMQWILLLFAGVLLAVVFHGASEWITRHTRLSIRWATALVLIGAGVLIGGIVWQFGSEIAAQSDQLLMRLSQAVQSFQHKAQDYQALERFVSRSNMNLEQPAKTLISDVVRVVAAVILVLFVGAYLSVRPELYLRGSLRFFPDRTRRQVRDVLYETGDALRWWILGQMISMAVVGIITTIGLLVVGVPMAVPLALIAALLTFVPYIGAIISAIPALMIGFSVSTHMALYVVLVFLIAHAVEGYLLAPMVQHRFVYLPPALILANQFLMELLVGVVGVALATPLLVVEMVLIERLYFHEEWDKDQAA